MKRNLPTSEHTTDKAYVIKNGHTMV